MRTILSIVLFCFFGVVSAQTDVSIMNSGLRFCESTLPYKGGILVANFGTDSLNPLNSEGKGYIMFLKDGKEEVFIPADGNLSAPKGMYSNGSKLFVCDVNKIVIYNLQDKSLAPVILNMPEGNLFVNDLVSDGKYLYASVTNTDKVFRIDISGDNVSEYAAQEWIDVPGPNGIFIDNGSMYIVSYPADGKTSEKNVVYKVDDISNPKLDKFIDVPGQYDGVALSSDGEWLYITNWAPAQIAKANLESKKMEVISLELDKPLAGPADISIAGGNIYIPDLPNSRVVVIKE